MCKSRTSFNDEPCPFRQFFRLKMAEYANLVRRAVGQLRGHGGVRGFFLQLFRSVKVILIYCILTLSIFIGMLS